MKAWDKKRYLLVVICIACTVLAFGESLFVQLAYYHNSVNSDLAGHFLSACVGLEEHTLIPHGYNHTSALGFESHAWLMPLFLALFHNVKNAAIASNLLMLFFFSVSSYILLRSFKVSKIVSYLCAIFLQLPFNIIIVDMHALSQYYLVQLIGACITIAFFNVIADKTNVRDRIIIYGAGGGVSFLEALNGSRYIVLIILPFALLGGYVVYEFVRTKLIEKQFDKECFIRMIFLLCTGIGAGIGYITYFVMTNYFSTYSGNALGFTAIQDLGLETIHFFDRIRETAYLWLILWGFRLDGQNMVSLNGVETIICLFLPIQTIVLTIKIWFGSINKQEKYFAFYTIVSLLVPFLLTGIMESVIPTVRYLYFVLYYMLFILPIYFSGTRIKTIIKSFFDTLTLITAICFAILTQVTVIKGIIDTCEIEMSEAMTVADYRDDINEWLVKNGYSYGYATYWNANVATVLSDCKVNYCALYIGNDMELHPFFGGSVRKYYNSAEYKTKTFILLSIDENDNVNENLPKGYIEKYCNEMFVVYGYETNPYDFSVELLQYFPIKHETVILEQDHFFTQGDRVDGTIALNENKVGGYLVYGPSMTFPIDAVYDIEYNFALSDGNGELAGYIAVTANGTEEIARADIMGEGQMSMRLENIPINKDDFMVQFIIYINAGYNAAFEDVRVTRVR